jgi:hypothetical protein
VSSPFDDALAGLQALAAQKDGAYKERQMCVLAIARAAERLGCPVWLAQHDPADASWDADWRTILFIELHTGQVSWHLHDSEVPMFEQFRYTHPWAAWDGHSTEEKYRRLQAWLS